MIPKMTSWIYTVVMIWFVAAAIPVGPAFAASGNDEAVRAANSQFYDALAAMFVGDAEPMGKVWSHADDVVYMGPDGSYQTGWTQVQQEWVRQAAKKLGGKVSPERILVTTGKDIATVSLIETGENKDAEGKSLPVSIRATNLFRLEGGKWKMIGHHTDKLPFLADK